MKKINLKSVSEFLSEKEMKNVMGGSGECANGSDRGCYVIRCVGGSEVYYTACLEGSMYCDYRGGTVTPC